MIKKLTIRNFKAMRNMTIEFMPLTVLIGGNACGKSTVLQALDFLRSIVTRDIPEYLRERGWNFTELKSKFDDGNDKPIEFLSEYQFTIDGDIKTLCWNISVDLYEAVNWNIEEKIETNGNVVLLRHVSDEKAIPESFKDFHFQSSMLKHYTPADGEKELIKLKQFLASSVYYGLLSPDIIRLGKKTGMIGNIGTGGEWLAAFIYHADDETREKLNKIVSDFIGTELEVRAADAGSAFMIITRELYKTKEITIDSGHASDGLLRIIAFAAIILQRLILRYGNSEGATQIKHDGTYTRKGYTKCDRGMILLDEVENGINPYLAEKAVGLFRSVVTETSRQVIVTTHSPVLLNGFKPEDVVFLWKDKTGNVHSKKFFDTEDMREALDFLNPGEIWENYGTDTILKKLDIPPEDR
ncbi:MAG: AAA family ATPase [Treponema sp.]|jgi:predicted ATPase|nr:AAA family ATPase [Treponema sp.]